MTRLNRFIAPVTAILAVSALASCANAPASAYECATCEVALSHVTTLGDGSEDGLWGPVHWVAADDGGRLYVGTGLDGPQPHVFAGDGRFLGRLPTEALGLRPFALRRGEVLFLERDRDGRLLVTQTLERRTALARVPSDAVDWSRGVWIGGSLVLQRETPPGAPTFAVLGPSGTVGRSFGPPMPDHDPVRLGISGRDVERYGEAFVDFLARGEAHRTLAPARGGGVWAAPTWFEYRIERWSDDGGLERVLEPGSEWFEAYRPGDRIGARGRPFPAVVGMWEDGEALWVVGLSPDPEWDPTLFSNAELLDAEEKRFADMHDVVLEALDPATGDVLRSRRVPDMTGRPHVLGPGTLAVPRRTEAGYWLVDVYRVEGA